MLGIYLAGVAAFLGSSLLYAKAFKDRLEREGYTVVSHDTKAESATKVVTILLTSLIPVVHWITPVSLVFATDMMYEHSKETLIKDGHAVKKHENSVPDEFKKSEGENTEYTEQKTKGKSFEEMTNQEKIEVLRSASEFYKRLKNSESDLGENLVGDKKEYTKKL